jgi:hypothetical protein
MALTLIVAIVFNTHITQKSADDSLRVETYRHMKFIITYSVYSCDRLTFPLSCIWYNYTQQDGILKGKRFFLLDNICVASDKVLVFYSYKEKGSNNNQLSLTAYEI